MKISCKKIIVNYICWFPLINIAFFMMLQGGYTNVFYFFSELLIVALSIRLYGISTKDAYIVAGLLLYVPIAYMIHGYLGEMPIILNFIYFVFLAFTLNNDCFKTALIEHICNRKRQVSIISLLYISIVLVSIAMGTGFLEGWGTVTLKGPYGTPHTLAYELLILVCLNLILILQKRKTINVVITFILVAMILFTAVRSALVGLIILLLFFVSRFDISKKIFIFIVVSIVGAYMIFTTSILDPILEKTNLAISNGSISNGRIWIFKSSIDTFIQSDDNAKWIVGIGYDKLLEGNLRQIHYTIQAHNDILNAIIAFGVIICVIFVYAIFRMASGKKGTIYKFILLMMLVNLNGLVSYMSFSIPIMIAMVFLESDKIDEKAQLHSRRIKIRGLRVSMPRKKVN